MSYRLDVKEALRVKLMGHYNRIYVYPEENDQLEKFPKVDFILISELPGVQEQTLMDASEEFRDFWRLAVYIYCSYGEHPVPSDEDAAAKERAMVARDTLQAVLTSDYTILGTVEDMGTDESVFNLVVTPLQWRGVEPAYGVFGDIPVITRL